MDFSFNEGWNVQPLVSIFSQLNPNPAQTTPITLPHDAMLALPRAATNEPGNGYYPGGAVAYMKEFDAPQAWQSKRVSLEFHGVYRDAVVLLNNTVIAHRPNGYSTFRANFDAALRYGETNTIRVEARAYRDSRWYSGLGIYRNTILRVTDLTHFAVDGVRITTPDVEPERAVVETVVTVDNEDTSTRRVRIVVELVDPEGQTVRTGSAPMTLLPGESGNARVRTYLPSPARWGVDNPNLYTARVTMVDAADETVLDHTETTFGIRTLQLDPQHGLRINGQSVKLRGACVHHDNGPLGAAAINRAEERKVELLKAAGFNAIRSSHNPVSPALLDACDRLGMLVIDEAFDMWTLAKNPFDYSLAFLEWWERDLTAMVNKDFNHPSVIAYSIGNEVLDAGTGLGPVWGRRLAELVRSLDSSRFVTNGISGFVATILELFPQFRERMSELSASVGVNDLAGETHGLFDQMSLSDEVTDLTEEANAHLDFAGNNYAHQRYLGDHARFPDRIVVGTETHAHQIDETWALVRTLPHVIGDFTWTGFDYLGEAGLGITAYSEPGEPAADPTAYPAVLAYCGDIDITGFRRPASYYREIVFGLRDEPFIASYRPETRGKIPATLPWAWSDTVATWTWAADEESLIDVEVYSADEQVELFINGRSMGTQPTGPQNRYRATFSVPYERGQIEAVASSQGTTPRSSSLKTAGPVSSARVSADRERLRADDTDLAYITIELTDAAGNVNTADDRPVTVAVSGAGTLQGLASGRPITEEKYLDSACTSFFGRALAVVRPTGAGTISVTVTAIGIPPTTIALVAATSTP